MSQTIASVQLCTVHCAVTSEDKRSNSIDNQSVVARRSTKSKLQGQGPMIVRRLPPSVKPLILTLNYERP